MSLSTLKPVPCRIPPASGGNRSHSKASKVIVVNKHALPPLQVKEKEKPMLQQSFAAASRREMMRLTAASVGLLSLILPASAEARTRNATMRQKILEKLEELRQKAGLSKPKNEGEDKKPKLEGKKPKDEDKKPKAETEDKKPKPEDEAEDKKPKEENKPKLKEGGEEKKAINEEPSVPALPNILNGKIVENTLP